MPGSGIASSSRWRPFTPQSATLSLLLLLLILGPAAGYFARRLAAKEERKQIGFEFHEYVLGQVARLRESTITVMESLYSLRSFFDSSETVTREEFASFTREMRARQPILRAVEWIPKVPAEERIAHEAAARLDGLTGYRVTERGPDGSLRPVGPRDEYFPVYYVEPHRGNEPALGFDVGCEPIRSEMLSRARRDGSVALSAPLTLVQAATEGPGFLAALPIHERGAGSLLGFVLIAFRIEDLARHTLLLEAGNGAAQAAFQLSSVDTGALWTVIYKSAGFRDGENGSLRDASMHFSVGGQEWRLSGYPTEAFLGPRHTSQPTFIGLTVLLGWELSFGLLFFLARRTRNRTQRELTRADEMVLKLSSALEQTADMVFITDLTGTIEYVNPAFEKVFGYSRSEAIGSTPRILKSGMHGPDYYSSLWSTVLAGEVFRAATINRKKDGDLLHTEQTVTPMQDSHGRLTHFVSVCKDMTEKLTRRKHEAELAAAALVQERLYPARPPRLKGLDVAGAVFSAEATCGDCFDYIAGPDGDTTIVIGDVSGHGLGPALVMAQTRGYLRAVLRNHGGLDRALRGLNRCMAEDCDPGCFVTMLAVKLEQDGTGFRYASAGHVPGFVMRADAQVVRELEPTGPALGIIPDADYSESATIDFEPGDVLLLLTDGVTESRAADGSFFEESGALEVVRKHRHETAREIVEGLYEAARAFDREQNQTDDITIVVVKVGAPENG